MGIRAISYWGPALGALALLSITLTASANSGLNTEVRIHADGTTGQVTPSGPVNTSRSPARDRPVPLAAGILAAWGGIISGDTYMAGNDFEDALGNCGYSHFDGSGNDEVWEFRVEGDGRWTFDTCTIPAGWDTTLALFIDDGIGFPGVPLVCNGDACGYDFESALTDICLAAGTTYWLVVDGWSPASWFPGDYYDVSYSRTEDPCSTEADCDDGDVCNGLEVCVDGCCETGVLFCERWEECDPATQTCTSRYDKCVSWAADDAATGGYTPQCFNGCPGSYFADDIQLQPGAGHNLISYQVYTQARNVNDGAIVGQCTTDEPAGTPYAVTTELLGVVGGGRCEPDQIIPGAGCFFGEAGVVRPSGSGADINICEPNGGLPTGIILPTGDPDLVNGDCGVDFFIGIISHNSGGGASLATTEQFIGGPALDQKFGQSVVAFEECTVTGDLGTPLGTWRLSVLGAPTVSDARGFLVCTVPAGPCCYAAGGCAILSELACADTGGTSLGLSDTSTPLDCADVDVDGDGFHGSCDNCPDVTNPLQRDCNSDGDGDACEAVSGEQDADNDGACNAGDPCPLDPYKSEPGTGLGQAPGQCGCGVEDLESDGDGTADCRDQCPLDPYRIVPGLCGCNQPIEVGEDDDGDGVPNCTDVCPRADDAVFAPGCQDAIPTASEWGLVAMALLLLVAGKVYFGRGTIIG